MIYLKQSVLDEITLQGKEELPNECCGFLAGLKHKDDIFILERKPLRNIDNSPEHFSMDPKEQFEKVKEIRNENLILLGNYHSHPESPARPSEEDKRLAYDENAIYGIISYFNNIELKLFNIKKGEVTVLEYQIIS